MNRFVIDHEGKSYLFTKVGEQMNLVIRIGTEKTFDHQFTEKQWFYAVSYGFAAPVEINPMIQLLVAEMMRWMGTRVTRLQRYAVDQISLRFPLH